MKVPQACPVHYCGSKCCQLPVASCVAAFSAFIVRLKTHSGSLAGWLGAWLPAIPSSARPSAGRLSLTSGGKQKTSRAKRQPQTQKPTGCRLLTCCVLPKVALSPSPLTVWDIRPCTERNRFPLYYLNSKYDLTRTSQLWMIVFCVASVAAAFVACCWLLPPMVVPPMRTVGRQIVCLPPAAAGAGGAASGAVGLFFTSCFVSSCIAIARRSPLVDVAGVSVAAVTVGGATEVAMPADVAPTCWHLRLCLATATSATATAPAPALRWLLFLGVFERCPRCGWKS